MREKFIKAYCYCYGETKKKAAEVYRKATAEYIQAVIDSYDHDTRKAFYND